MRFYIYEDKYPNTRHIAWIGKYTYGCCHIKGISVSLFSKYGEILDARYGHPANTEPNEYTDLSALHDDTFRNEDCSFRASNFIDIKDMLDNFHPISDNSVFFEGWAKKCSHDKEKYLYSELDSMALILSITKDELKNEIKEIEKICFDNNITIFWA